MLQTLGAKGLYRHLYMFKRIKIGTLVGVDQFGNKYFENKDYPYGQHRWVEHKNWDSGMLGKFLPFLASSPQTLRVLS